MQSDFNQQWDELMIWERAQIEERPFQWFEMARTLYKWQYKQWFLGLLNYFGDVHMARGKSAPPQKKLPEKASGWTTFVTISLDVADEKRLQTEFMKSEDVYAAFDELIRTGYRVGFSFDFTRDAVICSVTCKEETDPNFAKTFTSFADDWYTALRVSCYKHFSKAQRVWEGGEAPVSRPKFG